MLNNANSAIQEAYVIGVDFGTDSVRAVLVDVRNGEECAQSVFFYPRWKQGLYCDANRSVFRQHPLDYIEGLTTVVRNCTAQVGKEIADKVVGISIDTTGSTPVAVNAAGVPLSLLPEFEHNPNAMFVLWKDHTATEEALSLNSFVASGDYPYLKYVGGIYSSEWFWAKWLHILKSDEQVRSACFSWVEHCDWIPFLLSGSTDVRQMKRSVCAAGHKALWHEEWGGLPPEEFWKAWHPLLANRREQLFQEVFDSAQPAGYLSSDWATKLGLKEGIVLGVGAFDCHMGAVGGQVTPGMLSKVMGTSTCDMMVVAPKELPEKPISGICGQVLGSIIPGMVGLEAGQSAFGDAFAWFRKLIAWPLMQMKANSGSRPSALSETEWQTYLQQQEDSLLLELTNAAALLNPDEVKVTAIDWLNGRRTPDANQLLTGAFTGVQLGTDAVQLFYALAEATCFGAKAIVERIQEEGVQIKGVIGLGGVAKKSSFLMQMMADVLQIPIQIHKSEQTCAAGAAMFAAVAAGIYPDCYTAMQFMGQGFENTYTPQKKLTDIYNRKYQKYKSLGCFLENSIKS
jgi:L-ribulokinase